MNKLVSCEEDSKVIMEENKFVIKSIDDFVLPLQEAYGYERVEPVDFYYELFPEGEFQNKGEFQKLKYNGIALEILDHDRTKRYTITDEHDTITDLLKSPNFVIISPISYVGKTRSSKNARCFYALCIEVDNILTNKNGLEGLSNLVYQFENSLLPKPTFLICSGNGVHLYYQFEKPLFLFPKVIERLQNYKRWLTRKIWNRYVTTSYNEKDVQYESLFQGFRMVGGVTKRPNERTVCFKVGEKVSVDYMNSFLPKSPLSKSKNEIAQWESLFIPKTYKFNSTITLEEAKKLYPDWYDRRVVRKQKGRTWTNKVDLYNWWLREITEKGTEGHRYYCLMMLVIYALKCGVSEEQVRKDAESLLDHFESLTPPESKNHFTMRDINDALKCYKNPDLITYPINSIMNRTGIPIEKNRRNGRKQPLHLQIARATEQIINPNWRNVNGQPIKKDIIKDWRLAHPNGNKYQCFKDTKISRPTIDKWWSEK